MKENIESNRRRFLPKVSALAVVAGLAISGCGSGKDGEWIFGVDCPEGQEARIGDITTGYKSATIEVACSDNDGPTAPTSVELLDGRGVTIDQPANDGLQRVTVGYEYTSGPLMPSQDPEISSIKKNSEDGFVQIALRDMSITEVSVSEQQG